ncbi:MAG: DUF3142 domain-containing protein [Kiritimatiellaeota bacterium]|nr:DUF3142 domain-containing protein [Kiritimatiellota bacterium]
MTPSILFRSREPCYVPPALTILKIIGVMSLAGVGGGLFLAGCGRQERPAPPLSQAVYVWQRQWNESVRAAVREAAGTADAFVVLAGEIQWTQGRPQIARVEVDHAFLKTVPKPVGLAIRIGEHAGLFSQDAAGTQCVEGFVAQVLAAAQARGLRVAELQLDFDCAESRLADYTFLIARLKPRVTVPLVITALPCWLHSATFARLAQTADGFVLQVHSLEKPSSPESASSLCAPAQAAAWVEQASRLGVPFRVALPTYGYLAAFSAEGKLLGISAEGPARSWGGQARLVAVRADALRLAPLLHDWRVRRTPSLTGIVWYRLPVRGDRLNWSWHTLAALMRGEPVAERVAWRVDYPDPPLAEIALVNTGQTDVAPRRSLELCWTGGCLLAGDGLAGYVLERIGAERARLCYMDDPAARVVGTGDQWQVAWLRFDRPTKVLWHEEKP